MLNMSSIFFSLFKVADAVDEIQIETALLKVVLSNYSKKDP